ncbi:MAG: hypothetical protein ACTSUE_07530 [Promethearchaeota archaeon]
MSLPIDPVKFCMMFIKLTNCFLSITLSVKIKKKSKYILNYLFFLAFLGWGIFIGTDGVLFVIAPINEALYIIANLLRDLGIVLLGLTPISLIIGAYVIKEGEEIAIRRKMKRLIGSFVLNLTIIIGIIITDTIYIFDGTFSIISPDSLPPLGGFSVNFDMRWMLIGINSTNFLGFISNMFYLTYIIWYGYGALQMLFIARISSGNKKKRARLFMVGIILIPIGIAYFAFIPLLLFWAGLSSITWIFMIFGQIIWGLSPVIVFSGFTVKEDETNRLNVP